MSQLISSIASFPAKPVENVYQCDNCDYVAREYHLLPAKNLSERLDHNGPHTDKECPHCGALCYPVTAWFIVETTKEVLTKMSLPVGVDIAMAALSLKGLDAHLQVIHEFYQTK